MKYLTHFSRISLSVGIALLVALIGYVASPFMVQAQTESSTSPSAELREIIRQRIEETIQEKNNDAPKYIGTLGSITKVSTSTFSITDTLGLERTIEINDETTLLLDGEPAELSDLSINSGVVVMGSALDEVIISAKRILVQDEDFTETREVFLGTITAKSTSNLILSNRGTNEDLDIALTRSSEYEDSLGSEISLSDVQEDQSVLIVTDLDDDEERYVSRLRLLVPVESLETDNE